MTAESPDQPNASSRLGSIPAVQRYRADLEYDGSDFFGWQLQPDQRTVQGEIEAALGKLFDRQIRVNGAGRTDTGVHALAQVAHFEAPAKFTPEVFFRALNGILPPDVRVFSISEVEADFHARFQACWRWYRYRIFTSPRAVERRYGWYPKFRLDPVRLERTAEVLLGEHDFTAFSSSELDGPNGKPPNKTCQVLASGWELHRQEWVFHIVADRFLRHLVRTLVGMMTEVARGRFELDYFSHLLAEAKPQHGVFTAPPQGLYLMRVGYGSFPYLDKNLQLQQELPIALK